MWGEEVGVVSRGKKMWELRRKCKRWKADVVGGRQCWRVEGKIYIQEGKCVII